MSRSSLSDERIKVKDDLFQIIQRTTTQDMIMSFENSSDRHQYKISYQFEGEVVPQGDTQLDDGSYVLVLQPGQTKPFVRGFVRSGKRTVATQNPDPEWHTQKIKENEEFLTIKKCVVEQIRDEIGDNPPVSCVVDECIEKEVTFVDLEFPPGPESFGVSKEDRYPPTIWLPASMIGPKNVTIFGDAPKARDVAFNKLGNYMASSLAWCCQVSRGLAIREVFDAAQHPQIGCYALQINSGGWWHLCILDHFLPVYTTTREPIFCRSKNLDVLWVSLIEKAFAKLLGSFVNVQRGDPTHVLYDVIGFPYRRLETIPKWNERTSEVWKQLKEYLAEGHYIVLQTRRPKNSDDMKLIVSQYERAGLDPYGLYTLSALHEVEGYKLCKIKTASEVHWNGDWGADSPRWESRMKTAVRFDEKADDTLWMAWGDTATWFESGCISFVHRKWYQLRAAGHFVKGCPDFVCMLTVTKTTRIWIGGHQPDIRGLQPGAKYAGIQVAALATRDDGSSVSVETSGNYTTVRDTFINVTLEPSARSYFIFVQAYQDVDMDFTLSLMVDNPSGCAVQFVTGRGGVMTKCNPVTRFRAQDFSCDKKITFQILSPLFARRLPRALQGSAVNWYVEAPSGTFYDGGGQSMQLSTNEAPDMASSMAMSHSPPPPPEMEPRSGGQENLSVTILSARDLEDKINACIGVSILKQDGTEKCKTCWTKGVKGKDPLWGETFKFTVSVTDVVYIECYDKSLFSKKFKGSASIHIDNMQLVPGGNGKMDYFSFRGEGATGEVQVLFAFVNE